MAGAWQKIADLVARRERRVVWALIAIGTVLRLIVALSAYGNRFDIGAWQLAAHELDRLHFHAYAGLHPRLFFGGLYYPWPYPPGFMPVSYAMDLLHRGTGMPFHLTVKFPLIAADAGIALIVWHHLRRTARPPATRVAAVALVALGPSFAVISGYNGQFDALAVLPAIAGYSLWTRLPAGRRALPVGVLIGVAAAIKHPLLLSMLPLLPAARTRRELVTVLVVPVAVLAVAFLPFYLAESQSVRDTLHYRGLLGMGGISLVAQPNGGTNWLGLGPVTYNSFEVFLFRHSLPLNLVWIGAVAAMILRFRPAPDRGYALLWLGFLSLAPAWGFWYMVWALPFFLMAGAIRRVAIIEGVAFVPTILFYVTGWHSDARLVLYVVPMITLWLVFLLWLVRDARTAAAESRRARTGRPVTSLE